MRKKKLILFFLLVLISVLTFVWYKNYYYEKLKYKLVFTSGKIYQLDLSEKNNSIKILYNESDKKNYFGICQWNKKLLSVAETSNNETNEIVEIYNNEKKSLYNSSNGIYYPRYLGDNQIIFIEADVAESTYNLTEYDLITKTKTIIDKNVENVLPSVNDLGEILYVKYDDGLKIFKLKNGKKSFICNGTYPVWSKNGFYFYKDNVIYYSNFSNGCQKTIKTGIMLDGTPALSKDGKYMVLILLSFPWTPGAMWLNSDSYILNLKTRTMFKIPIYNDTKLPDMSLTYGIEFMD